jgi:outer membrane protein assembly factor BamB
MAAPTRWIVPNGLARAISRIAQSTAIVAVLVVALGACSSSGTSSTSGPAETPSAQHSADTTPTATSTYAARRQATIAVDGADGMTAVGGALWVKTDPGHVVRINPNSNKVTDTIHVDHRSVRSPYCQGIGTDKASVWSCTTRPDGTDLAQIDPATRRVMQVVSTDKVFDQLRIPASPRGVWVLSHDGSQVTVVDPASGHATSYSIGCRCQQLDARGNLLVATSSVDGKVVAIDATSGRVLATTTVSTAHFGDYGPGRVGRQRRRAHTPDLRPASRNELSGNQRRTAR